jgi:hypothetical protein
MRPIRETSYRFRAEADKDSEAGAERVRPPFPQVVVGVTRPELSLAAAAERLTTIEMLEGKRVRGADLLAWRGSVRDVSPEPKR